MYVVEVPGGIGRDSIRAEIDRYSWFCGVWGVRWVSLLLVLGAIRRWDEEGGSEKDGLGDNKGLHLEEMLYGC